MKKVFVIFMTLMLAVAAMAQETNRTADGKIQYGPYETNRFFDNVFVGVGGGANFGLDRVSDVYSHGWGLNAEGYVGKYFTPEFGVRFGWQGVNTSWNKDWAWPGNDDAVLFNYVHGDLLWNISNQFWGYKETRTISVVPYLHGGVLWGNGERSLGVGAGVEFPVRVSNRVAIVPDLRVMGTQANFIHPTETTGIAQLASATLSVRVTLGKPNWVRKATTVAYYSALCGNADVAIRNAQDALNAAKAAADKAAAENAALVKENEALKAALEDAKNAQPVAKEESLVLFFEIGKDVLSDKELAHLEAFANSAKGQTVVVGGTDTKTGSAKRNAVLRQNRAEYVRNLLINKYGFNANDVTIGEGVTDINESPAFSRVAIVTVK